MEALDVDSGGELKDIINELEESMQYSPPQDFVSSDILHKLIEDTDFDDSDGDQKDKAQSTVLTHIPEPISSDESSHVSNFYNL